MGNCFGTECVGLPEGTPGRMPVKSPRVTNEVLFFPDPKMPCKSLLTGEECKRGMRCTYAHTPTSLSRLLKHIEGAQRTLDVCVFTITCNEIADAILAAHKRGVRVRVITDDAQRESQGSDIDRLKQEGVPTRDDGNPNNFMHHKFAVVDAHTLINGSFNWTRHAVLANFENIVISSDPVVCRQFIGEFERLWGAFGSRKYT